MFLFDSHPGILITAAFMAPFVCAAWLYHDATLRKSRQPPSLWALLGFIGGVGAVLVWLVMRPKRAD